MVGLIDWARSFTFDSKGNMIKDSNNDPIFASFPQSGLWKNLVTNASTLANNFDVVQLPPPFNGPGEAYSVFEYRNFINQWGNQIELLAATTALHKAGVKVAFDIPFHQMTNENGGPGVYNYKSGIGNMNPGKFQYFAQPGEDLPPAGTPAAQLQNYFRPQDSIPDTAGDWPDGRVVSYENCLPAGWTESDRNEILALLRNTFKNDLNRWDEAKAMHQPSVLRMMNSQPGWPFYVEYFDGNRDKVDAYVRSMNYRCAAADYPQYWYTQGACNNYDATSFNRGGYWQINPSGTVGFVSNPDVSTSWSPTGGISEQIAFNLLLGYALAMNLPQWLFLVYADDYYPASPNYPTGKGLMPFLNNMTWVTRTFAYGNFQERWVDKDVYCYTRDGNGGPLGWSGGLLVAANFNTFSTRNMSVQTMWSEGTLLQNYSMTGKSERYTVGKNGIVNFVINPNSYSNGQSYVFIAPAGVDHPVAMYPIAA